MSWHGALHNIAPVFAFVSVVAACLVFARRFAAQGQRRWVACSVTTAVATVAPDALFGTDWFYVSLGIATVLGFGWASAVAARLMKELPERSAQSDAWIVTAPRRPIPGSRSPGAELTAGQPARRS
jgi:hypothetical protein